MTHFDFTGYRCPLTLINVKRALKRTPGEAPISFIIDDPDAVDDLSSYATNQGYRLNIRDGDKDGEKIFVFGR